MSSLDLRVGDNSFQVFGVDVSLSTDQLLIGQGFNTITGGQGGMAVEYNSSDELTMTADVEGQKTKFTLVQITSFQSLKETLSISAAASFGIGIFSADATFNFFKSTAVTSYNSYLFVDVIVRNNAEVLKRLKLTEAALDRAELAKTKKDQSPFLNFAGNGYVYGRRTGGRLTAVVQFSSKDSEDYTKVNASLNAAVAGWGDGEGSFEQTMSELSKVSEYRIHVIRDGGIGKLQTLNDISEAAKGFPELVTTYANPVVLEVFVRGYNTVDDMPDGVLDGQQMQAQQETMEVLGSYISTAYETRGDLEFILSHPEQFMVGDNPDTENVMEVARAGYKDNEKTIRELNSAARSLALNPRFPAPVEPTFQNPRRLGIKRGKPEKPPKLPVLQLFKKPNYEGDRHDLAGSLNDFTVIGFNDEVWSFKLNGEPNEFTAVFFQDVQFIDRLFSIESPAAIPNVTAQYPTFRASSVQVFRNP